MTILITDEKNGQEKPYEKVAERLEKFRTELKAGTGFGLIIEMIYPDTAGLLKNILDAGIKEYKAVLDLFNLAGGTKVRSVAKVLSPEGKVLAVGAAEKDRNDNGFTEATVEWVQTKAIGRCLAAAGYGTGEISSADEILDELRRKGKLNGSSKPANEKGSPPKAQPEQSKDSSKPEKTDPSLTSAPNPNHNTEALRRLSQLGVDVSKLARGLKIELDASNGLVIISGDNDVVLSMKGYLGQQHKFSMKNGTWQKKVAA